MDRHTEGKSEAVDHRCRDLCEVFDTALGWNLLS